MANLRCMVVWLAAGTLVPQLRAQVPLPSDSVTFIQLEQAWNEAHLHGDGETLAGLWAEELIVTVPAMTPMSKAESLGFARSGRMSFSRYQTTDLRIHVYGDAAVVTGRLQRTRSQNNRQVEDDWRFTKVYVRREGRWQVVAFHASPAAP